MKTKLFFLTVLMCNLLFAQNFSTTPVYNPFGIATNPSNGVYQPTFIDIDNDGDFDLLMGRSKSDATTGVNDNDRILQLFENIGTVSNPVFSAPVTLLSGLSSNNPDNNWVFIPSFADLDNDGDYDLLVGRGSYSGPNFEYYENTGTANSPVFSSTPTSYLTLPNAYSPALYDFDNDGDYDLITGNEPNYATTTTQVTVQYFENTGTITAQNFSTTGVTVPNITGINAANIALGDLNLDGNIDLLLAENSPNLKYFTSDNTGNITPMGTLVTGVDYSQYPALVDIDNDGDLDVFIGSEVSLVYFENTATASINNINTVNKITVYPNPVKDKLYFNEEHIISYKITDILGKTIQKNNLKETHFIDLSNYKTGIYFIKLKNTTGNIYQSKIIKK